MKRYMGSTIFIAIVVISIVGFYAIYGLKTEKVEGKSIQTISGKPTEIKDITLLGEGYQRNQETLLTIKENEQVIEPLSLVDHFFKRRTFYSNEIEQNELEKQYKSFMRGKVGQHIYNDKSFIISAQTNDINHVINISYLDKVANDSTDLQLIMPKKLSAYTYTNIIDIKWIDNYAVLIVNGQAHDYEDMYMVKVDFKENKITDSQLIYSTKKLEVGDPNNQDYQIGYSGGSYESADYISFMVHYNGRNDSKITPKTTLYSFNVKEGTIKELTAFKEINRFDTSSDIYVSEANHLYYINSQNGSLYDIDLEKDKLVKILQDTSLVSIYQQDMLISNGKCYVLYDINGRNEDDSKLLIIDIEQKKKIYEGNIKKNVSDNSSIILNQIILNEK